MQSRFLACFCELVQERIFPQRISSRRGHRPPRDSPHGTCQGNCARPIGYCAKCCRSSSDHLPLLYSWADFHAEACPHRLPPAEPLSTFCSPRLPRLYLYVPPLLLPPTHFRLPSPWKGSDSDNLVPLSCRCHNRHPPCGNAAFTLGGVSLSKIPSAFFSPSGSP